MNIDPLIKINVSVKGITKVTLLQLTVIHKIVSKFIIVGTKANKAITNSMTSTSSITCCSSSINRQMHI